MGLFYRTRTGSLIDFTLELKPDWFDSIRVETMGRRFAAEWFPQSGVQIIWPTEETDWAYMLGEITSVYIRLAYEIAKRERLLVVTSRKAETEKLLREKLPSSAIENTEIFECPINDTWARDSGMLTILTPEGHELLDFRFNGWGGKYAADKDNKINLALAKADVLTGEYRGLDKFVLEGGSVETDGNGTLLTTESCLLSPNRNAGMAKGDVETMLKRVFNVRRVLWLRHGHLLGDDTDGHVDTLARLCPGGIIAYTRCDDHDDPQYAELKEMENELKELKQEDGKPFKLVALPLPSPIYDKDTGERLPATYANYLVMNSAVLMPTYGQPAADEAAARALGSIYEEREIVGIPSSSIIRQHGSLHCCTMQFPAGVFNSKKIKAI